MAVLGAGAGTGYPAVIDTAQTEYPKGNPNQTKPRASAENDVRAAIIALETILGTNPQGALATVKAFLLTGHNTDGTHSLADFSDIGAYLAGTLVVSSNTMTLVPFDTEEYDDLSEFDIMTNKGRFTASKTGTYLFTIGLYGTVGFQVHIFKDGVDMIDLNPITNVEPASRNFHLRVSAGSYVEIKVKNPTVGFNLIPYGFESQNSNWVKITRLK